MSPLPKMEILQSSMGTSRKLWTLTDTFRGWYCSAVSGICWKKQNLEQVPRAQSHRYSFPSQAPTPYPPQLLFISAILTQTPQLTSSALYLVLPLLLSCLIHHRPSPMEPHLHLETLEGFPLSSESSFSRRSEPLWSDLNPPLQHCLTAYSWLD